MNLITSDGSEIYYNIVNKKQITKKIPLVFIHGWMANWTCFKGMIDYFKKKKYPVVYLDLRGNGLSKKPTKVHLYKLEYKAEDINQILKKEKIKKIILIGHSMGGMVAALFATRYPKKVEKLILIQTYYKNPLNSRLIFFHKHIRFSYKLCKILTRYVRLTKKAIKKRGIDFGGVRKESDTRIGLRILLKTALFPSLATLKHILKFNIQKNLKNLKMPVLLIGSKKDQFFPERLIRDYAVKLPDSQVKIIEGTHTRIFKKHKQVSEIIQRFIKNN